MKTLNTMPKKITTLWILVSLFLVLPRTFAGATEPNHFEHGTATALSDLTEYKLEEGSYYLTQDLQLDHTLEINGKVNLCLNGFDIKPTIAFRDELTEYGSHINRFLISLSWGDELNLYDCQEHAAKVRYGYWEKIGYDTWYTISNKAPEKGYYDVIKGGIIGNVDNLRDDSTNDDKDIDFRGIVFPDAKFNMYGGNVVGCRAPYTYGAGLTNGSTSYDTSGKMEMHGGTIAGNYAGQEGGGISIQGNGATITIYGGKISNNKAGDGGSGLDFYCGGSGIMYDGEISHNGMLGRYGSSGGAVKLREFSVSYNPTKFQMLGGCIKDNEAYQGSAIYVSGNEDQVPIIELSNGEITENISDNGDYDGFSAAIDGWPALGDFTLSGSVHIFGNKEIVENSDGIEEYMPSDIMLYSTTKIKIGSNFETVEPICVRRNKEQSLPFVFTEGAVQDISNSFLAMDGDCLIKKESENSYNLQLTELPKEETPAIEIDYIHEQLIGFLPDGRYTIEGENIVPEDGKIEINSSWFGKTLSVVKMGIKGVSTDSQPQSLTIAKRPVAPKEISGDYSLSETPNKVKFTVDPISGAEYSMDGINWQDDNVFDAIEPEGHAFYVRKKAISGNAFVGDLIREDFPFSKLSGSATVTIRNWEYGSTAVAPSPVSDTNGTSHVIYMYKKQGEDDNNYSMTVPENAGKYTVKAIFAETAIYDTMVTTADFEISPRNLTVIVTVKDKDYDGTDVAEINTSLLNGLLDVDKEKVILHNGIPSFQTIEVGNEIEISFTDFSITGDAASNYILTQPEGITASIKNDWCPTKNSEFLLSGDSWMNKDFVITAKDGFQLSATNTAEGAWSSTLIFNHEGEHSATFYIKDMDGRISNPVTINYKIDRTAPTGTVRLDDLKVWSEFLNTINFDSFYKDSQNIEVIADDALSGVLGIQYYISSTAKTLDEIKALEERQWKPIAVRAEIVAENNKQFVCYICITDKAGNKSYISTDGATFDTQKPIISGIENTGVYYVTQKITVNDSNLSYVTQNAMEIESEFYLGAVDALTVYEIKAEDCAGNITVYTITMRPISDVFIPIKNLTVENVKMSDKATVEGVIVEIEQLLTNSHITEEEKSVLDQNYIYAQKLLDKINQLIADQDSVRKTMDLLKDGIVKIPKGADEETKTAFVQEYVDSIVENPDVTLVVTHKKDYIYTVVIKQNTAEGLKDITIAFHIIDTKVENGSANIVVPIVKPDASEQQKEAIKGANEALKESGAVQENGLDKVVIIDKKENGDFVIRTGENGETVILKKEEISQIVEDNNLTDTSSVLAETFLQIQVMDAKTQVSADANQVITSQLTFDIQPFVKVSLVSGNYVQILKTEAVEIQEQLVSITLPLPSNFIVPEGHKIQIVHTKQDGTKYYYDATQEGDQISFDNPHGFSTFTIQTVEKNSEEIPVDPIAPITSEPYDLILWFMIATMSVSAFVILLYRMEKKSI